MIALTQRTTDPALAEKIREISGQMPGLCIQCGTCSSVCPMDREQYIIPRRVMLAAHLGLGDHLRDDTLFEMCLSCSSCAVRCPRGIDIPAVMDALRQVGLRRNIDLLAPEAVGDETLRDAPQVAMVAAFRKLTS